MSSTESDQRPWYSSVTRYQWLVLVIACLGWIFDVFEGQIFVASMREAIPSLLPTDAAEGAADLYNNVALAAFLVGGAVGGVLFGMLSDRIGRTKTMILTILVYSLFTCVTAFATSVWQMVALRFLVAMGVGGEWAVASALVAEVFPARARAWSLGIFHASSVFGTYLAVAAGAFIVGNPDLGWRWGFAIGALPALLIVWIRLQVRESDRWLEARKQAAKGDQKKSGRLLELFSAELVRNTFVGVSLAAVGMATFWGVHIYGKDIMREAGKRLLVEKMVDSEAGVSPVITEPDPAAIKRYEMAGMFLVTTGGGLGLIVFAPIAEWLGRRGAFAVFHAGGLMAALLLFNVLASVSVTVLVVALPLFGFFTLGMHAGYAIYFPELFPTRLRGTGGGFCFNVGKIVAAPILILGGVMQKEMGFTVGQTASWLALLYLLGLVVLLFARETKGRELMA